VPAPDEPEAGLAEAVRIENSAAPAIVADLTRVGRISIFAPASPGQVAAVLKGLR